MELSPATASRYVHLALEQMRAVAELHEMATAAMHQARSHRGSPEIH